MLFICFRGDVNSWARVTHESHEHWPPTNNDDFTVACTQWEKYVRSRYNILHLI